MRHWLTGALATWFRWTLPRGISTATMSDRDRLRKARLLSIAVLAAVVLGIPLLASAIAAGNGTSLIVLIIFEGVHAAATIVNRLGYVTAASWVYIIGYITICAGAIVFAGTTTSSPIWEWVQLAIPSIFAGLFLPFWTPLLFGVLDSALVTLIITLLPERVTQLRHYFPNGAATYFLYIYVMMGAISIICTVSSYMVERAVAEADRTQELADAHAALEILHADLSLAYARLEGVATTDAITGLLNHRALEDRLQHEVERSHRTGEPLAVLFADLDHFKQVNDTWGHKTGDDALAHLAAQLTGNVRAIDVVARYGGEEFVLLLPGLAHESAAQAAERLRQIVADTPLARPDGVPFGITVSLGVAVFPDDGANIAEVMDAADQAMYHAKRAGRNRVCVARDDLAVVPVQPEQEAA